MKNQRGSVANGLSAPNSTLAEIVRTQLQQVGQDRLLLSCGGDKSKMQRHINNPSCRLTGTQFGDDTAE
jgi:hypothetical protein